MSSKANPTLWGIGEWGVLRLGIDLARVQLERGDGLIPSAAAASDEPMVVRRAFSPPSDP